MTPAISILMANYNKRKYIAEAINSVIRQTHKDWELVIMDDASTDNSVDVIKFFLSDSRIKLYHNETNQGTISAQRQLIDRAEAEIVGILDSDDALDKRAIEFVLAAYKNSPDCGFVYTGNYACDETLLVKHLGDSGKIPKGETNLYYNLVNHFKTFKKSAFHRTSGYDDETRFGEDIDLIFKLEEVTKLYFIDKPLYYYRVLPKSQTHSFRNTQINRSSTAIAKLNAYKRRIDTSIPNLNIAEISEVLFLGVITSFLARRIKLGLQFIAELIIIHPLFIIDPRFYFLIFKKIKKLYILKQEKPLLKI